MLSTLRKVYMDDPNTPSLLSMLGPPYASVLERAFQTALDKVDEQQSEASKIAVEKVFRNTRRFVWSEDNPTFIQNGRESHRRIAGLGSVRIFLSMRSASLLGPSHMESVSGDSNPSPSFCVVLKRITRS